MKRGATIALASVGLLVACGALAVKLQLNKFETAFEKANVGDDAAAAVARFGEPSIRETPLVVSHRYSGKPCTPPCIERLTWENPVLLPGMEAWTLEVDGNGRVLRKDHWVSP
jgi:hypothetical protein